MNVQEKQAYDVPTFCRLFSIGKTRAYQEIKEGRLKIVKVGKRTLITARAASDWIELISQSGGHHVS